MIDYASAEDVPEQEMYPKPTCIFGASEIAPSRGILSYRPEMPTLEASADRSGIAPSCRKLRESGPPAAGAT